MFNSFVKLTQGYTTIFSRLFFHTEEATEKEKKLKYTKIP